MTTLDTIQGEYSPDYSPPARSGAGTAARLLTEAQRLLQDAGSPAFTHLGLIRLEHDLRHPSALVVANA